MFSRPESHQNLSNSEIIDRIGAYEALRVIRELRRMKCDMRHWGEVPRDEADLNRNMVLTAIIHAVEPEISSVSKYLKGGPDSPGAQINFDNTEVLKRVSKEFQKSIVLQITEYKPTTTPEVRPLIPLNYTFSKHPTFYSGIFQRVLVEGFEKWDANRGFFKHALPFWGIESKSTIKGIKVTEVNGSVVTLRRIDSGRRTI